MTFLDVVKEKNEQLYQSMRIRYVTGDFDEKEKEKIDLSLVNHRDKVHFIIERSDSIARFKEIFDLNFSAYYSLSDFISSGPKDFKFGFPIKSAFTFDQDKKVWEITCIAGFNEEKTFTFSIKNGNVHFPKEALVPFNKSYPFILWEKGIKQPHVSLEFMFFHHPTCKNMLAHILMFTKEVDSLLRNETIEIQSILHDYQNLYIFKMKNHPLSLYAMHVDKNPRFSFNLNNGKSFEFPIGIDNIESILSKSQLDQLIIDTQNMIKEVV